MNTRPGLLMLTLVALLAVHGEAMGLQLLPSLPNPAKADPPALMDAAPPATLSARTKTAPDYIRPQNQMRRNNYLFDAFGPYPIAGALITAGINQFSNSPPEWHQGVAGYSRRFGSDLGIAAVATTTRTGLSEALRQDTLYYRCECAGILPRARHAMFSTLTARRFEDGRRVFSWPALIAPYAGTMTGVYGWYPRRYGAKDAFRKGNYSLLAYAGGNLSIEFLYSGPHSLLSRMHLDNRHAAAEPGPNHEQVPGVPQ